MSTCLNMHQMLYRVNPLMTVKNCSCTCMYLKLKYYYKPLQTITKCKRPKFSLRNEGDNAAITMILIFCTGMKLFHEIFHAGADSHVHHNHTQSEPKAWKPGRDVPPGCRGGRHIHLSSQYPRVHYQISLQCSFVFIMELTVE